MRKYLLTIIAAVASTLIPLVVFATVFNSAQVGSSPVNGYILQTNGLTSTWAPAAAGSGTVTSVALTVPQGLSISGSPITTSGILGVTFTSGYNIPFTASTSQWNSLVQSSTSLPYVTSITALTPLTGGTITTSGSFGCQTASGSQAGCLASGDWATFNNKFATSSAAYWLSTYGLGTFFSTTSANYWGTSQGYLTSNQTITLSGDVSGSGATSIAGTLATVNSNTGSFTNASITVNGKGLITAASSGSGGGSAYPFVTRTNDFGTTSSATSTPLRVDEGIFASSTSQFAYSTSTATTASSTYTDILTFTGPNYSINALSTAGVAIDAVRQITGVNVTGNGMQFTTRKLNSGAAYAWQYRSAGGATFTGLSLQNLVGSFLFGTSQVGGNYTVTIASTTPQLALYNPNGGTNQKNWLINAGSAGSLSIGTSSDDFTTASPAVITLDGVNQSVGLGGTTTPTYTLSLGSGAIVDAEKVLSTSTTQIIDWSAGNQQDMYIGTAGTTISFTNVIVGAKLNLLVCNPTAGTPGTITWPAGILWQGGIQPGQTTTDNKCDVWSFLDTSGSTTPVVLGSITSSF